MVMPSHQRHSRWSALWCWRAVPAALVVAALAFSLVTWTGSDNRCRMSYSRPHYHTVSVPSRLSFKYTLYRYVHGGGEDPAVVAGYPLLFVPGHLGSFKQARSVASAAEVAANSKNPPAAVDYFAIDFGEEPSGLFGHLVWDHAEFVNDAVRVMQAMWARSHPSQATPPVTVVAHSLGGVATRAAIMLDNHRVGSIGTIVSLGTPQTRPPAMVDASLWSAYKSINTFWRCVARWQGAWVTACGRVSCRFC